MPLAARRATARVKKNSVTMLGASTPSASMSASAGKAEAASDARKEDAAKVAGAVEDEVPCALVGSVSAIARADDRTLWPTFDEFVRRALGAVTFRFDAATSAPPMHTPGIVRAERRRKGSPHTRPVTNASRE